MSDLLGCCMLGGSMIQACGCGLGMMSISGTEELQGAIAIALEEIPAELIIVLSKSSD